MGIHTQVCISVGEILFIYKAINFIFILLLKFYLFVDYFVNQTHEFYIQLHNCVYMLDP